MNESAEITLRWVIGSGLLNFDLLEWTVVLKCLRPQTRTQSHGFLGFWCCRHLRPLDATWVKALDLLNFLHMLWGAHSVGTFLSQRSVKAQVDTAESSACQCVPNSSARFGEIRTLTTTSVVQSSTRVCPEKEKDSDFYLGKTEAVCWEWTLNGNILSPCSWAEPQHEQEYEVWGQKVWVGHFKMGTAWPFIICSLHCVCRHFHQAITGIHTQMPGCSEEPESGSLQLEILSPNLET